MGHDTIGFGMIEIQAQPSRNSCTLYIIADGLPIRNRSLYYRLISPFASSICDTTISFFYHALPIKLAPTCFTKQLGTFGTQEIKCNFFFRSTIWICWNLAVCNIPLKSFWKYLSNGILDAPKFLKIAVAKQKWEICSCLVTAIRGGQKNHNGKQLWFLFA